MLATSCGNAATGASSEVVGRLEWQHHQSCSVAASVRSTAGLIALYDWEKRTRPAGFDPETFGSIAAAESAPGRLLEPRKSRRAATGAATNEGVGTDPRAGWPPLPLGVRSGSHRTVRAPGGLDAG
jgi:hypothetical protein